MILNSIEPRSERGDIVYPLYHGQSLANVPATIAKILGTKIDGVPINEEFYSGNINLRGIKKVVFFLFDGLGYRMLNDAKPDGFFKSISKRGMIMPITSVFPSTTSAAITTVSTGLTPNQHGLAEWLLYMKEIKMAIKTIPFTKLSKHNIDLKKIGTDPKILYNGKTFYQKLSAHGIKSLSLMPKGIAHGTFSNIMKKGSETIPYISHTDASITINRLIRSEKSRTYINSYMETIDTVTHFYGPFGENSRSEIASVSSILEKQLLEKADRKSAEDTLVIFTADHGHTKVDMNSTEYINNDKKFMGFLGRENGRIIPPVGSPRDLFIHIKEGKLDEAYNYISSKYSGIAKIIKSQNAVDMGLFGNGNASRRLKQRIGDIMILPDDGKTIWYHHLKTGKESYLGLHGGLSANEMLIPLGMARLSDII